MKVNKYISYSLILSLVITVIGPLNIIGANVEDFSIHNGISFLIKLICSFTILLSTTLLLFAVLSKIWRGSNDLVLFVIVIVIVWSLYLPLPVGKLDGVDVITVSVLNVVLGLLAGSIALLFRAKGVLVLLIIIIGPLITSIIVFYENINYSSDNYILNLSRNDKNVFVISFDSLQSNYVTTIIEADKKLKSSFKGFVNYINVNAVAPFTDLSTISTKLGYLPKAGSRKELINHKQNFITTKLAENGYAVETYSAFNTGELSNVNKIPQFNLKPSETDQFYKKSLEASLLRAFPFEAIINNIFGFYKQKIEDGRMTKLISMDTHPLAYYKQDILDFNHFIRSLSIGNGGATFRMHHYLISHAPMTFSKDCRYEVSSTIYKQESVINETVCVLYKMKEFIDRLKELGVYDNSLIILTSDHGYDCAYNNDLDSGRYNVSRQWCLSRYTPFLLVKGVGGDNYYSINESNVSLMDISKTICTATLDKDLCGLYTGKDLFSNMHNAGVGSRYILVSKGDKDNRDYSYFNIIKVGRESSLEKYFNVKSGERRISASNLPGRIGNINNDVSRLINEKNTAGYLTFGPYWKLPIGMYKARIIYKYNLENQPNHDPSYWDIYFTPGEVIYKKSFTITGDKAKTDELEFSNERDRSTFQLRSYYNGDGTLEIFSIEVEKLD